MSHYSRNAFCTVGMHQLPQQQSLTPFLCKHPPGVSGSPLPFGTVGPYGSGWFY